ncbi:hypothetical protein [Peptostreptococcus faecalis]|nr:hypothetical protein [Peptostreptococcus faecalis]
MKWIEEANNNQKLANTESEVSFRVLCYVKFGCKTQHNCLVRF